MVYELRCYTLKPGKMPEYLKAAETIGRPARGQNFGVNHGYWTAEFGALNQIWHLWKYDSYEERTRLRGELDSPRCMPAEAVPAVQAPPGCGDGTCDGSLEHCANCSADCGCTIAGSECRSVLGEAPRCVFPESAFDFKKKP